MIERAPSSQQFASGPNRVQESGGHLGRHPLKQTLAWHMITCEYPPQSGGVSDYSYLVASALASAQDEVHVWCHGSADKVRQVPGVNVHCLQGRFTPRDLRNAGRQLSAFPKPRRLLVQWVPHGYGYKSLNLPFCLWLLYRSIRYGDYVDLMVHEPFLGFTGRSWRQSAAAAVQRLMTIILLRAARHVWISIPIWQEVLRPYSVLRHHTFDWLPVPSNVPVLDDPAAAAAIRDRYAPGGTLIGHFGTYGLSITPMLSAALPRILASASQASVLLIGGGSTAFRSSLVAEHPNLARRVHATGHLDARELSFHISACDIMIQPYPDGVTSRRTTLMAALSHGRPVVTTTGPFTESFWKSSNALVLAAMEDGDSLVSAALGLLDSPTRKTHIAACALELYRSQFDLDSIIGRLREKA